MSKMKHLLRKLHIGGGLNDHQRLGETRPISVHRPISNPNPNSNLSASSPASTSTSTSTSSSATMVGRIGAVESAAVAATDRTAGDGGGGECLDFNFLEEEFQVQLALAISASDPDAREDSESAQIDAAKRISLGCPASVADTKALVDILSLHYWVFFYLFLFLFSIKGF